MKFILASASPRRKELIGHLKIPFQVIALNIPEDSNEKDPNKYSQEIANLKGDAVFNKLIQQDPSQNYFVVSADTIVCLNGKIFGKPKDRNEAKAFLSELSGKTHSVFTAVSIKIKRDAHHFGFEFVEESKVTFNVIAPELMERYLDTGDSLDKAGAYGIQGPSLTFISKVEGDYANVVGFPLSRFVLESQKYLKEESWFDLFY
ncbi:MAG: nucleoside triphosphate pyrophosphatase [Bacteriovoracaceae bacterium]